MSTLRAKGRAGISKAWFTVKANEYAGRSGCPDFTIFHNDKIPRHPTGTVQASSWRHTFRTTHPEWLRRTPASHMVCKRGGPGEVFFLSLKLTSCFENSRKMMKVRCGRTGCCVSLWWAQPAQHRIPLPHFQVHLWVEHKNIGGSCQRNLPVIPSGGAAMPHEIWRTHHSQVVETKHLAGISRRRGRGRRHGAGGGGEESKARLQPALKYGFLGQRPGQWEDCRGWGGSRSPAEGVRWENSSPLWHFESS